jgi:hypothetical protein
MRATLKFYTRPEKAPTCEVVPVLSNHFDPQDKGAVNLRFLAMGEQVSGEFHVRMGAFEALSLAAEIVLKVARGRM